MADPKFFEMTDKNDLICASSAPDHPLADRFCNLVPRPRHRAKRAIIAALFKDWNRESSLAAADEESERAGPLLRLLNQERLQTGHQLCHN
jgi:hypothetical protein